MNKIKVGRRIKSAFLDYVILIAISMPLAAMLLLLLFWNNEMPLLPQVLIVSFLFSFFLCKDLINGQSLDKKQTNLQVVNSNESKASSLKLILRNIFTFLWPIELLVMMVSPGRRLGDFIAGTRVINNENLNNGNISKISVLSYFFIVFIVFSFLSYLWITHLDPICFFSA